MSKPPPDLGEDSARLYESPGQKTEEMAVQLFRGHYTSGERARVKQRLSPPRFAVARPERERRSASKTNFQLSRPSGRWFVGLRYAVREDLSAVAGMASVSNGALDSQVDFLGRRCLKKGPLLNTGQAIESVQLHRCRVKALAEPAASTPRSISPCALRRSINPCALKKGSECRGNLRHCAINSVASGAISCSK
jgi:hypothetical protein